MISNKFNFFIPINESVLEKAATATGEDRYENMVVEGVASDDSIDTDGETLIPSGYDLTRFNKYGFINFDHKSKDNPKYLIGEPTFSEVRDNKFFVKGKLYKDSQIARDLWDVMITLHNAGSKRKIGWSIEGKALQRNSINPKMVERALITNVALTPQPKNSNSFADIVKGKQEADFCVYADELEKSEANGGKITYLVDVTDKKNGIRYTIDTDFNLKVTKSINTENAKPLIKESLEGKKKKAILTLAIAAKNGQISPETYRNAVKKQKIR